MIKLCSDILLQIAQTFVHFIQRVAPTSAPVNVLSPLVVLGSRQYNLLSLCQLLSALTIISH